MQERRRFIKGFGLLGLALSGAAAARETISNTGVIGVGTGTDNVPAVIDPPVVEDIAHLAPLGLVNIHFQADNRPPPPPPPVNHNSVYMISSGGHYGVGLGNMTSTEGHNNVKMSVGKDNRLWIEVDGQWRRVALDG